MSRRRLHRRSAGRAFNEKVTCDSDVSAASNGVTYTGITHPNWSRATYVEEALQPACIYFASEGGTACSGDSGEFLSEFVR
jgi:hypothetical protein